MPESDGVGLLPCEYDTQKKRPEERGEKSIVFVRRLSRLLLDIVGKSDNGNIPSLR